MPESASVHPPSVRQDDIRAALDVLTEGFQIIGPDWRYVYVNPAAARHGRRDASTLVGKPMVEAYPGIDQTPMFAVLRRCMEERTSEVIENQFTFPDGTKRWFELRIRPVPAGICIFSVDIEWRRHPVPFGQRLLNLFR
ncbi:MAG TPA: PAS domain-containing protein [Vicinamibacterales bacterium]|jgi:PAS domain S-box-containing protein